MKYFLQINSNTSYDWPKEESFWNKEQQESEYVPDAMQRTYDISEYNYEKYNLPKVYSERKHLI